MDIKEAFFQRSINFLIKKTSGSSFKNENMPDLQSAEELYRTIIKKIREKKSTITFYRQYLGFWSCWYAIHRLYLINYRKYTWVVLLKDKKCITITNAFQKFLKESNNTPLSPPKKKYGLIKAVNFVIAEGNHG